jgi:acetyl-CoA carboxylase biotin carboxyl carrier protein
MTPQGRNMPIDDIQQLLAWLADTDIALLELRGRGVHLRLRHDGERVDGADDDVPPALDAPAAAGRVVAAASSVGVFLHQHPLQEAPLARPGTRVDAGQTIGLLQIGSLLLPVCAARDATVAATLVAHGITVGYGTPLIELDEAG